MGCGRHFCNWCNQEMIHRDNRKHYESASCLGQITLHGPKDMGAADIDLCTEKHWDNQHLLRVLEHKQPHQNFDYSQNHILSLLASIISHARTCPHYSKEYPN